METVRCLQSLCSIDVGRIECTSQFCPDSLYNKILSMANISGIYFVISILISTTNIKRGVNIVEDVQNKTISKILILENVY